MVGKAKTHRLKRARGESPSVSVITGMGPSQEFWKRSCHHFRLPEELRSQIGFISPVADVTLPRLCSLPPRNLTAVSLMPSCTFQIKFNKGRPDSDNRRLWESLYAPAVNFGVEILGGHLMLPFNSEKHLEYSGSWQIDFPFGTIPCV